MSALTTCDVLVVGLGPAGASAAAVAARAGLRVIAIDRKREAGVPVQCAEFVPPMCGAAPAVLAHARRQEIAAMSTVIESGAPYTSPDFRGLMLDRAAFDAALAAEAEAAGADCRFGNILKELQPDGTAILGDGRRLDCKVIVGADGPRSLVGRAIGCENREMVETRQITVPLAKPHAATDVFLSTAYPGGYAWLFPKGQAANLGVGVSPAWRHRLKRLLNELHERMLAQGRLGASVVATTGGAIPVGGMVKSHGEIGKTLILLAGDAAGLTNPVTGAGISAAVLSGQMAGAAAVRQVQEARNVGAIFQTDLEDLFGSALTRALKRRSELLRCYAEGRAPAPSELARGWIAFPEYWAA